MKIGNKLVFVTSRPFQSSLMFVGKARNPPTSGVEYLKGASLVY
jgi:hypothetical protein